MHATEVGLNLLNIENVKQNNHFFCNKNANDTLRVRSSVLPKKAAGHDGKSSDFVVSWHKFLFLFFLTLD